MFSQQFQARYRIDGKLAEGGMGALFRATDLELSRAVAIKTIRSDRIGDASSRARFLAEAKITARLSHPNIVKVLDQGEDDGTVYIVYEFVAGEDLRHRLERESTLGAGPFLHIATGIAGAIEHAHGQHVVHRDLKPENVLLGADGRVVVGDFGVARQLGGTTIGTATGVIVGTLSYLSPEVSSGKRAGPEADVYALGVVAFEMLAGRLPFESENAVALLRMHADQTPPRIAQFRPDAPEPLAGLIDRTLAKDPAKRPTAADWLDALEKVSQAGNGSWRPRPSAREATVSSREAALTSPARRRREATRQGRKQDRADRPTAGSTPQPSAPASGVHANRVLPVAIVSLLLVAAGTGMALRLREPSPKPEAVATATDDTTPGQTTPVVERPAPAPPKVLPTKVKPPTKAPGQAPAGQARRRLAELREILAGPEAPAGARLQGLARQYTTILGVPFTTQLQGLDARAQQREIDRLQDQLSKALAWQPRGGRASLLASAARLLDEPEVTAGDADRFLATLAPFLDLEAFSIRRGLATEAPYHDFLHGIGAAARKRFVMAERPEKDLLTALAGGPAGDRDSAFEHWRRAYEGEDEQFVMERLDFSLALWFCRTAKGRPRVLAQECAARFATDNLPAAEKARYVTRPFQLALGNGKMGPGRGPVEVWVSRHSFTSSFRFDVSVEDGFTIPFRPRPSLGSLVDAGWLSFRGELAGPFARPGEVSLHAEVHLLPGEDLPAPNARLEDVSLGALEMMVQVWPPAGP